MSGREREYVLSCMESSWISSLGQYIERFEGAVTERTGAAHAIAVCNGTVALHLAFHSLDIGPGDEVIVPTFTYIASVNTIAQTGATPVFVECRTSDWLIDPEDVARKITPRTRAIVPVHLYGLACDMPALLALAEKHGLAVVEDCAEALGSTLDGRYLGTFGEVGTLSFFGNKTITTGEGGMVLTNNAALARKLRQVKGQGQSLGRRYWHDVLGFNYRMTNIAAAIGTAQMERFDEILAAKQALARRYRKRLGNAFTFPEPTADCVSSEWLVSLLLPAGTDRDRLMSRLLGRGVETRPVFYPAHHMPMYASGQSMPISEDIAARGISLPSYPALTEADQDVVIESLLDALD